MEIIMNGRVNNGVYKEIIIAIINVYIQPDVCFSSLSCNTP